MEAKLEKVIETEVAATLAAAVATRMSGLGLPADPQKASQKTLDVCMETWNVFQDFQAGEYAGIESNSGKIWSDPVAGIAAAANAGAAGASAGLAGLVGQLVSALGNVPGLPADVTSILTQLVGKIPSVPPVTPPVTPPVAKTLTPTA